MSSVVSILNRASLLKHLVRMTLDRYTAHGHFDVEKQLDKQHLHTVIINISSNSILFEWDIFISYMAWWSPSLFPLASVASLSLTLGPVKSPIHLK